MKLWTFFATPVATHPTCIFGQQGQTFSRSAFWQLATIGGICHFHRKVINAFGEWSLFANKFVWLNFDFWDNCSSRNSNSCIRENKSKSYGIDLNPLPPTKILQIFLYASFIKLILSMRFKASPTNLVTQCNHWDWVKGRCEICFGKYRL